MRFLQAVFKDQFKLDSVIINELIPHGKTIYVQMDKFGVEPLVVKMKSEKTNIPYNIEMRVIDYNNNGFFNDDGIDKIFIPNQEKDTLDQDGCLSWTSTYYPEIQFVLDKELYVLEELDPKGSYATVRLLHDIADTLAKIKLVSNVFNIDFDKIEQGADKLKYTFQNNEYSMIKMWFLGCSGCLKQVPKVKELREKYGIAVVGFNAVDGEYIIQKHTSEHDVPWAQYKVEKDLLKNLGNDCSYPYNILIDSNGNILMKENKIEEIGKYLKKQFGY